MEEAAFFKSLLGQGPAWVLVAGILFAVWRIVKWIGPNILSPIAAEHLNMIHQLKENNQTTTDAVKAIATASNEQKDNIATLVEKFSKWDSDPTKLCKLETARAEMIDAGHDEQIADRVLARLAKRQPA